MSSDSRSGDAARARSRSDFALLSRSRTLQIGHMMDQQLREAPLRTLAVLALLAVIWLALYFLLELILRSVRQWGFVGVVTNQHIFVNFFFLLAIMLTFSNAILTFSTLYGQHEAAHLLAMPLKSRQVVLVKWIEGLALSSWSFLLLGVPLMLAIAANSDVRWYFYPLFMGHFVAFVALPACVGLLAACIVAMWMPSRPILAGILAAGMVLLAIVVWVLKLASKAMESEEWLRVVMSQMGMANYPWIPSTWTAKGIVLAVSGDVRQSLFYLLVVAGNALFAAWFTVNLLGATWAEAYSRAQQGRSHATIRRGWITAALCWPLKFVLHRAVHRLMLKDVRYFVRDARQWTQMAIMLGLLVTYVVNLRQLPVDVGGANQRSLMAFLNLATVSLILATFTSRFVFPLLSLESQQLWLLGLLPVRRITILLVKFLFAVTVTSVSACGVVWLASAQLALPRDWALMNLLVCLSVCVGLSGLAIGLGARFPSLGERNPARIAAGFGGTINLIASMVFVVLEVYGVAMISLGEFRATSTLTIPDQLSRDSWLQLLAVSSLGPIVATVALFVGARRFARLEW